MNGLKYDMNGKLKKIYPNSWQLKISIHIIINKKRLATWPVSLTNTN